MKFKKAFAECGRGFFLSVYWNPPWRQAKVAFGCSDLKLWFWFHLNRFLWQLRSTACILFFIVGCLKLQSKSSFTTLLMQELGLISFLFFNWIPYSGMIYFIIWQFWIILQVWKPMVAISDWMQFLKAQQWQVISECTQDYTFLVELIQTLM